MITEIQLYMNLLSANNRAAELERTALRLRTMAQATLPVQLDKIDKLWNGTASDSYIAKGRKLCEQLNARAASLLREAQAIRRIAQRVYNTEMQAQVISQQRSF